MPDTSTHDDATADGPEAGEGGPDVSHGSDGTDEPDLSQEPEVARPPRRRLRDRWVLLTALVLLGALVVGTGIGFAVLAARLSTNVDVLADPFEGLTDRPAPAAEVAGTAAPQDVPQAVNILVLGSDSRISAGDPEAWEFGAQRTDAIMLVHLPADGSAAYLMSIPRDSWVTVPGYGEAKINAAFSYGGPTLLIQTIEQVTGVRIDHFAVADFEAFTAITNILGGVPITLSEELEDRRGNVVLPPGEQILTGEQALLWARERKNLARGDFDRVQRHQAWMRAIATKATADRTLANPFTAVPFLDALTSSVAVDDGMTPAVIADLVSQVRDLRTDDLEFFTVPISGIGTSSDGQSIVLLDQEPFAALMAAVAGDTVDEFLAARGDTVDRLPAVAP